MPDIPVFINKAYFPTGSGSYPIGWTFGRLPFRLTSQSGLCLGSAGAVIGWESLAIDAMPGGASLSPLPSSTPSLTDFDAYTPATFSHSGSDAVQPIGSFSSNGTVIAYTVFGYLGGFAPVLLPGRSNLSATVATVAGVPTVTLRFSYPNRDVKVNGTLYRRLYDKMQLDIDGTSITRNFGDLADTDDYSFGTAFSRTLYDFVAGTNFLYQETNYTKQATWTFPLSSQNLSVRLGTPEGTWYPWIPLKFIPDGTYNVTADGSDITLDASSVYVIGGQIRTTDGFQYDNPSFSTDSVISTVDADSSTLTGDVYTVRLRAYSNAGCARTFPPKSVTIESGHFGTLTDQVGALFSAVNEGTSVRVSKFKTGAASRELRALISNAKNPSIYKLPNNSIRLAYQDRSDGQTKTLRSTDDGRTFS